MVNNAGSNNSERTLADIQPDTANSSLNESTTEVKNKKVNTYPIVFTLTITLQNKKKKS